MAAIPLALAAYERAFTPEAILRNAVVEKIPTQQASQFAILARPGLAAFKSVGSGANRAMLCKAGLFDDAALLVQGTGVHTLSPGGVATALTGTVSGIGRVDIDAGQDSDLNSEGWIATGSALYRVTTAGVEEEDFPEVGGAGASSVCCLRSFVIASAADTDQVFVRVPGDATWHPLSFVSAEYKPDKVKAVRTLGEQVWLLGASTTEAWALGGTATPPLEPYGGLVFNIGCRSRDTAVVTASALIWVDDTSQVQMTTGGAPQVISDPGLTAQIRNTPVVDLSAAWRTIDGDTSYILTLGTAATWSYSLTSGRWSKLSSGQYDFFRIGQFGSLGERVICADLLTPDIYTVSPEAMDDAGETFPVEFTAHREVLEGSEPCANLELICKVGAAPRSGQGSAPLILMRYSDDGGESWSRWRERPLGVTGAAQTRVRFNGLGTIKAPYGRIFHFRVTDPVGRRFSDLRMNVP